MEAHSQEASDQGPVEASKAFALIGGRRTHLRCTPRPRLSCWFRLGRPRHSAQSPTFRGQHGPRSPECRFRQMRNFVNET